MVKLNHHYHKLAADYLFPEIGRRAAAFAAAHPDLPLIRLGIGDVTEPLAPAIAQALLAASQEMGTPGAFRGYGPSEGYPFLREAIATSDYAGLSISPDEIFISDGSKCDIGNIQELFAPENRVALPDPTYPVYLDTTIMAGRSRALLKSGHFGGILYLPCTRDNGFCPSPPSKGADLVYLCSPNNPTGAALTRSQLAAWVAYAHQHRALLLFDGAYEAYVSSPDVPKSIYEIPGAHEVAVEFRSFSKTAGFTGLRCAYTVIPQALEIYDDGRRHRLHALWKRRCDTKFNGVSYPVQRAAEAVYTAAGKAQVASQIRQYKERALLLKEGLKALGYQVAGGVDAPYLWCEAPPELDGWGFFDRLLSKGIVSVPGQGFGAQGSRYIRLSAFAPPHAIREALERIRT
jgi:LL-diaminopimelate aminotransferase